MINRAARGRAVGVFDATAGRAAIAVAGPHSRELMTRVSPDDWSNEAQGYGWAREVEVDDGHALCLRVSLVGELGYVLYPTADQAVNVYDALVTAGRDLGLLDPYTAGLGSLVALDKPGGFVGRDAVEKLRLGPHERCVVYVALRDPQPIFVDAESIYADNALVGRLTSGSDGYTLGRACGIGLIRSSTDLSASFTIDCGGQLYAADVSPQPFYDATDGRLQG